MNGPDPDDYVWGRKGKDRCQGMILDEVIFGCPIGASRLENVFIESAVLTKQLGDEKDDYTKGQTESIFDSVHKKLCGTTFTHKEGHDGVVSAKACPPVKKPFLKKNNSASSDDVDLLGGVSGPDLSAVRKAASSRGAAGKAKPKLEDWDARLGSRRVRSNMV
jgi:hypothetical protein